MSHPPDHSLAISTYEELDEFVKAFAADQLNLLVIIGRPGTQKSSIVREALGERACWIDGNVSPFGLYHALYLHQHAPVIIDDVDALYANRASVRLLKSLCQTEPCKRVAWHSCTTTLGGHGIPNEFDTSSRVVIIANEWKTLNANVSALEDRGHVVFFDPTPVEVHLRSACWFWDQEIYDFVGQHLHLASPLSMRDYGLSWELKQSRLDWRSRLLGRWGVCRKLLVVCQLKSDPSFAREEDRAQAFVEQGVGCRATYFKHAKKLRSQASVPHRVLGNPPPCQRSVSPEGLLDFLRRRHGELGNG